MTNKLPRWAQALLLGHSPQLVPLLLFAAIALVFGLFARFTSLGAAPLNVDEYFIIQAVGNVLRSGWPEFECGGWYQRGIVLQYLAAGLQLVGFSAAVAPRLVAVLSSLLVLPAAYLIARRTYAPAVGWLVIALLSVSIWEIEVARFGRMYAPFQAVTAWYVVYFLRYTVDRQPRAFAAMVLLTVVAIFTWEGGVLLAAANFLPPFLLRQPVALSLGNALRYAGLVLLLVFGYWFAVTELRWSSTMPPFPEIALPEQFDFSRGLFDLLPYSMPAVLGKPGWLALAAVPVAAAIFAIPWAMSFRQRPIAVAGFLAIILTALGGQFAATATLAVLLVLFRFADWGEILGPRARRLHVFICVSALYWLAFIAFAFEWDAIEADSFVRKAALFAYQFVRVPDFVSVALWPWARAVPVLGAVIFAGLLVTVVRVTRTSAKAPLSNERALLAFALCTLVAASLSEPPRVETRYVFFLYPFALVLGLGTLWTFVQARLKATWMAPTLTAAAALGAFVPTEDFDLDHLLHVDRPSTMVRAGMDLDLESHLTIREDTPALAGWLREQVVSADDVVITGFHSLDFYYDGPTYFYIDYRDPDFRAYSCLRGTIERWGNQPLLYTTAGVEATIPEGGRAFVVVYDYQRDLLLDELTLDSSVVWSDGLLYVIEIGRAFEAPRA